MNLDVLAYQLIIEMRRNPLASLRELSERLNVSPNTIKNRQQQLRDYSLIRSPGKINDQILGPREITEVVAHHAPSKLGLKRVHVLFDETREHQRLLEALDLHPYTYYRVSAQSKSRMVYAMFDVPVRAIHQLQHFLDQLRERLLYSTYHIVEEDASTQSFDRFSFTDDQLRIAQNQREVISSLKEKVHDPIITKFPLSRVISSTPELDTLDLYLIRELTINSKVQPTRLSSIYGKERSTLSRRINKIREIYIEGDTLIYDRSHFNLDSTFLIYSDLGLKKNAILFNLVKEQIIPYFSNFYMQKDGSFFWQIYAPTSFCNDLIHHVLNDEWKTSLALLNTKQSVRYFFYPNNYQTEEKSWNTTSSYMVDDVLYQL